MMIATCIESDTPRGLDDCLDMLQVAQQGLLPDRCNAVLRSRSAGLEGLCAHDIARFLELARVSAQIAVADVEQGFEFIEGELLVHGERTHDAEADALVNQAVESGIFVPMRRTRHGHGFRGYLARVGRGRFAALDGAGFSRHGSRGRSGCQRKYAARRIPGRALRYAPRRAAQMSSIPERRTAPPWCR